METDLSTSPKMPWTKRTACAMIVPAEDGNAGGEGIVKNRIIRRALQNDVEPVARIYEKIHSAEENGQAFTGWKRGIYPEKATAQAAMARGELFVEEEDGAIVGAAIFNQTQGEIYAKARWQYQVPAENVMVMHTLVIDPDVKGRGAGRFLAEFYEDYAAERGCLSLRIDTNEKNVDARRFYERLGYREIDILPCIFHGIEGVRLVLLEKRSPSTTAPSACKHPFGS